MANPNIRTLQEASSLLTKKAGHGSCQMAALPKSLVKDPDKLILGQNLTVTTPHVIKRVLKQQPGQWLSKARITKDQALLLNPDEILFQPPSSLNPAMLLPHPDVNLP